MAHFCTVLGFPKRNLAKLAEHIDKFIAWFRNHGIEVPKEEALTLLGYITKAEKQYVALAEKEAELNGKKASTHPRPNLAEKISNRSRRFTVMSKKSAPA